MLATLATGIRFRIAMAMTVFAALCLVAPPAVLAFGHGENTLHCLANVNVPFHGVHQTSDDEDQRAPSHHDKQMAGCCGLFCVSAVVPDLTSSPTSLALGDPVYPQAEVNYLSQIPDLPDPPPISLLSA